MRALSLVGKRAAAFAGVLLSVVHWGCGTAGTAAKEGKATVPVYQVKAGSIQQVIRVTGTTAALDSYIIVAPQLTGSRGNRGRQGGGNTQISSGSAVSANTAATASSAGSSTSSGQSGALRAATSRVGALTSSRGSASTSSSSSTSAATSTRAASGSTTSGGGQGSTASGLVSWGGQGGGRRGDFDLIVRELVATGSRVKKGDVIAQFDDEMMRLRYDDYAVSLRQAEEDFQILKADLEVQRKAYEQSKAAAQSQLDKARLDMRTIPVLGRLEAERLRLQAEEAEARLKEVERDEKFRQVGEQSQLRRAQLDLEQSRIELQRIKENLDRLTVRAPADGMVVVKQTWVRGEIRSYRIGDQLRTGEQFMVLVGAGSMILEGFFNQVDAERLRIGQRANIKLDSFPGVEFPGKVLQVGAVSSGAFRRSFVAQLPVRILVEAADSRILPDLSGVAEVSVEEVSQALVVPRSAVHEADGKSFVFVKRAGKWEKQRVDVGPADPMQVAVTSGLEAGLEVALSDPTAASE